MKLLVKQYYATILLAILALAFFSRVFLLHQPQEYVFDEVYHAVTAKLMAENDPRAFEWWNEPPKPDTAVDWLHPPVAKYTQAFFIYTLGDNSFAWRFSSVVFGVGVVWLTALLAKDLFNSKAVSLLAALLAAIDGLLLVQSRVAMNDIHVTFFILLTFLLYWKHLKANIKTKSYNFSSYLVYAGISAGVAIATKWSGAFALMNIGLIEGFSLLYFSWQNHLKNSFNFAWLLRSGLRLVGVLLLIPAAVYLASYWQMFLQGKGLDHLVELHQQIWHYQTNLQATHPAQSRPWEWFLNLKPVWIAVDYASDNLRGNIYSFGNPVLFILGAASIIWTTIYLIFKLLKKNLQNLALLFALVCYGLVWLPWQFSPRIMFFYHYAPAVPLMVIILSFWLYRWWHHSISKISRGSIIGLLLASLAAFVVWYPHWTNIPVPTGFANKVYFLLERWR